MIDADKLLKEGAARRERAANRRMLLEDLRRGTRRRPWLALLYLPIAGFYFWHLTAEFLSTEPMVKGDVLSLLSSGTILVLLFYAGVSCVRIKRRDLFLIELLEERVENENEA